MLAVSSAHIYAVTAAAQNNSTGGGGSGKIQNCPDGGSVAPGLQPIVDMLEALIQLGFVGGILAATLGFMIGGTLIAMPFGQEWNQRGRRILKGSLAGIVIIFSSTFILSFAAITLTGDPSCLEFLPF
jgi:hypothetical protein